jgi:uncharacterized protein YndB with AHSA1/START domain
MMRRLIAAIAVITASTPAHAELREATPNGFVSAHEAVVAVPPAAVWAALVAWQDWWPAQHSYSGKAPALELKAGGALSERWAGGEVLHATVVNMLPPKMLRLRGEFGPLQSMPVTAVLDFILKPEGNGTKLAMQYRVAGGAATLASFAKPVDGVMAEGFARLVATVSKSKN